MAPARKPQLLGSDDDFWIYSALNPAVSAVMDAVERFVIEMMRSAPGPVGNPGPAAAAPSSGASQRVKSGKSWVAWADQNAKNSQDIDDLAVPFKTNVKEFIKALEDAGATVKVDATRRDANTKLHAVGASYGVKKHTTDAPHWSVDGH